MRKTVLSFAVVVGFICILTSSARGDLAIMDFDFGTGPSYPFYHPGDMYVEEGMKAIPSVEVYNPAYGAASIGDWLGQSYGQKGNGTNGLYFHGYDAYVEISRVDGSSFDLFSLDLMTNIGDRWLETSSSGGAHSTLLGSQIIKTISFVGSDFSGIEWFRVGTSPGYATQIDNVTVSAVPVPGAALLGALGLSVAGWRLRRQTV